MELKYWSIQVCYHCVWCVHVQRFTLRMSQYCTGQPTAQGTEGGACFGRPFYLTCHHGYTTDYDVIWSVNGSGIGTSDLLMHTQAVAPLPPKITTIESLTERTSLTWTHNTSDIEYVVRMMSLSSVHTSLHKSCKNFAIRKFLIISGLFCIT